MALSYEAADWQEYQTCWYEPHRQIEPLARERAVIDEALQALVRTGILPHAIYNYDKLIAHRRVVAAQFAIPWTTMSHRVQCLLYAINAIRQPQVMVTVGTFCGTTFIANAGAAIGPGACYEAQRLVGLEIRPAEADQARRNVARFRDDGHPFPAEILSQDGLAWLREFGDAIDLLYLDVDGPGANGKSIYLSLLLAALHAFRPGTLVLAHNSVIAARTMSDYLATVRSPAYFRQSVNLIVDDQGLEVSLV